MKKIYSVLTIAMIFISGSILAQVQNPETAASSVKKRNFWYGPRVGLDLATPTLNQDDIKAQLKSNYQIGLFMQIGRKIYLQPEVYITVEKEKRVLSVGAVPEEVMVNSLKVPVLIGIKLIDIGIISAHVMAGPVGSFFLSESQTNSEIVRQKADYNLQVGGGVDLLGFVNLDVRYAVDLNDQVKEQLSNLAWENGVNVTLGLKFK
jgi:hypothetical protein